MNCRCTLCRALAESDAMTGNCKMITNRLWLNPEYQNKLSKERFLRALAAHRREIAAQDEEKS